MPQPYDYDAVIVGAGPNGLSAAVTLAREGCRVLVLEAGETVGGAARSAELTLPGFVHDLGSSIHPLAAGSPLFRKLPLDQHGLTWIHPDLPLAHPLEGGRAAVMHRSVEVTAAGLEPDAGVYRRVMGRFASSWAQLAEDLLRPVLHVPRHPLALLPFGLSAIRSARGFAEGLFESTPARALFAGIAAHSALPLESPASAAFGLVLGVAGHAGGWPMPRGGAQKIADALAAYLHTLGGVIRTASRVDSVDDLPPARAVLLDVTPRQLLRLAGHRLPEGYRRRLKRYRYGPGVFKIDYALSEPIPWAAPACAGAGTVHLGGTLDEVAAAEREVAEGRPPERPFILLAQHSRFDASRAPEGRHTAWAYCHVPLGSPFDMTERMERQIERFAPGFRDCVLARHVMGPAALERFNPNLVGGDINGGSNDLFQLVARPVLQLTPYKTPLKGFYLCSSSTPPGGGVHGMCGYHAAQVALREMR